MTRRRLIAPGLLLTLAFIAGVPQRPLYSGNQNTHFLHGLARAEVGHLQHDWLARSPDFVPAFSALVQATVAFDESLFFVYYALLLAAYLWAVTGVGATAVRLRERPAILVLALALVLLHSQALDALTGGHVQVFHWGLAGQYLLGPYFQPSNFGILLVVSLLLYLRDRPYAAVVASAIGATVHTSLLLPAGILTAAYMVDLWRRDGSPGRPGRVGALSLLLVLPVVIHLWTIFQPTSPAVARRAHAIIAEQRIPHHAQIGYWFGKKSALQVAIMVAGVALPGRTSARIVLGVALGVMASLTAVQLATGSHTLALLFPWRLSSVLVPVSTAIILAVAARRLGASAPTAPRTNLVAGVSILAAVMLAIGVMLWRHQRAAWEEPGSAVAEYVRSTAAATDTYLVPPSLQSFRIAAAAPIFVDWKSLPVKDVHILEWHDRTRLARRFYEAGPDRCGLLRRLVSAYGITHVVVPRADSLDCSVATPEFTGDEHRLYRVAGAESPIRDR